PGSSTAFSLLLHADPALPARRQPVPRTSPREAATCSTARGPLESLTPRPRRQGFPLAPPPRSPRPPRPRRAHPRAPRPGPLHRYLQVRRPPRPPRPLPRERRSRRRRAGPPHHTAARGEDRRALLASHPSVGDWRAPPEQRTR